MDNARLLVSSPWRCCISLSLRSCVACIWANVDVIAFSSVSYIAVIVESKIAFVV